MNYCKSEETQIEQSIKAIADAGAKVVIANGAVSDLALHFANRYDLMVIKITSKFELRRLCGALGATALIKLGAPSPEELGDVASMEVKEVAGRKVIVLNQNSDEDTCVATVIVRAATQHVLNDVERALDDGVHAVKTLCTDPRLLPGAGAVELEIAKRLRAHADEKLGLSQYSVRKFAEALEVIPRTLAENSGCDTTAALHALNEAHNKGGATVGFNVDDQKPFDAAGAGVWDLYATKFNAMRLAVDAAVTVLKVDQIVMSKPAGGPKPPGMR
jgi:T-complex protein 1 subunit theta